MARTVISARSMRTHDMTQWTNADFTNPHDFGPAMIVPLLDAQGSRGAMLMVRRRQGPPFTLHDVDLASTFAAQVALAMELNDTRAEAEWVRVLEDRHRIAQDLHDNVMQRLFATGVGLQALTDQQPDGPLAARLRRHIVDLDETIDEIRSRVFGLRDDDELESRPRRNRFPHVARAAAAARSMGNAAVRSLTPRNQRRDEASGIPG
jgi:signal transduction histidine kinase